MKQIQFIVYTFLSGLLFACTENQFIETTVVDNSEEGLEEVSL